jgi:hypothetical protein
MKIFVLMSVLFAGVWLMMMLTLLSADMYPRRQVFQRHDDQAKAILIAVYILVGASVLLWSD